MAQTVSTEQHLKDLYGSMTGERDTYLFDHDRLTKIIAPWLHTVGDDASGSGPITSRLYEPITQPYSDIGTRALGELVSGTYEYLFPAEIEWYKLKVPEQTKRDQGVEETPEVEAMLSGFEDRMNGLMAEHQAFAEIESEILPRVYAEGQVLVQVTADFIRAIPSRHFVVQRYAGTPQFIVFEEEVAPEAGDKEPQRLYTLVDYRPESFGVYQQTERQRKMRRTNMHPDQHFIVTTRRSSLTNYVHSFAYQFYGSFNDINILSRSIQEIAIQHAQYNPVVDPNSPISKARFAELENGEVVEAQVGPDGRAVDFGCISFPAKINDTAVAEQRLQRLEGQIEKSFAMGIIDQRDPLKPRTATEVLHIAQQLNRITAGHSANLEPSLQLGLVRAYMIVLGYDQFNQNGEIVRPVIISGMPHLTRQVNVQKLMDLLTWLREVLPPEKAAQINWIEKAKEIADKIGLETENLFHEITEAGINAPPQIQGGQL